MHSDPSETHVYLEISHGCPSFDKIYHEDTLTAKCGGGGAHLVAFLTCFISKETKAALRLEGLCWCRRGSGNVSGSLSVLPLRAHLLILVGTGRLLAFPTSICVWKRGIFAVWALPSPRVARQQQRVESLPEWRLHPQSGLNCPGAELSTWKPEREPPT